MKWQKARKIRTGVELWVKCQPPEIRNGVGLRRGQSYRGPAFFTNHIGPNTGRPTIVRPEHVELLPEFADDVAMIPWSPEVAGK